MPENVQDWCTAHLHIFVDVGTAVGAVAESMEATTRTATARQSLDAPEVRAEFAHMGGVATMCRRVVDQALALPAIPDAASQTQFRTAMELRGRWADAVMKLAQSRSLDDSLKVENLGQEATRQGALIEARLRRAWPDQNEA